MAHRRDPQLQREIGRRLAEARRRAGWSQERLASAVGTAPNAISRIETGSRSLSVAMLGELARALGLAPGELFDGDGAPAERVPRVEAEETLLAAWRRLSPAGRELAVHLLHEAARRGG